MQQVTPPYKVRFDGTVNLGHLLIICGFVISAFSAYMAIQNDIQAHHWRLNAIESALAQQHSLNNSINSTLTSIGQDIAVIKTKMDQLDKSKQ